MAVSRDCALVSIGMPVHNGMPYIEKALESLLCQSHSHFELIVSDDCSTDGTAEVCARYADSDPRITLIVQPRPLGMWGNFQFVLDRSTGEYFMWAAQDDTWDPRWVETALSGVSGRTILSVSSFCTIDENGKPVHRFKDRGFTHGTLLRSLQIMYSGVTGVLMYGVFDAGRLKRTGAFSGLAPFGRHAEHLFLFRVAADGPIESRPGPLMLKRVYDPTAQRTFSKRNILRGVRDVISQCSAYLRLEMPAGLKAAVVANTPPFFAYLLILRYRGTSYKRRNV